MGVCKDRGFKGQNPSPLQLSCKSALNPTSAHCLRALVSMNCSGQCGVGDVLSHQYLLQTQLLCKIWSSAAFLNSKIKPHKGQVPNTRGRVLLLLTQNCLAKQTPLKISMKRPLGLKQAREGASGRSLCPNGRKEAIAGVCLDRDSCISKDAAE